MPYTIDHAVYKLRSGSTHSKLTRLPLDSTITECAVVDSEEPVFELNDSGQGMSTTQDGADLARHFASSALHASSLHSAARTAIGCVNVELQRRHRPKRSFTIDLRQRTIILKGGRARTTFEARITRTS